MMYAYKNVHPNLKQFIKIAKKAMTAEIAAIIGQVNTNIMNNSSISEGYLLSVHRRPRK
jgi:hypothetical protein